MNPVNRPPATRPHGCFPRIPMTHGESRAASMLKISPSNDQQRLRSPAHNLPAYIRFDRPALAKDIQGWLDRPESNFGWFFTSAVSIVEFASREDEPNATVLTVYTGNPDAPRAFWTPCW